MDMAYLDHNATTPLEPRVLAAMLPWLENGHGNPSSRHRYGRAARAALDEARARVADAVGAHPAQVIFVSGGTEANNLFLRGAAACLPASQLLVSAIEHPSVHRPAQDLQRQGWQLRRLAVDEQGRIDADDLRDALATPTGLVSMMLANNETGVVQDMTKLSGIARDAGALVHSDAVQALGKLPVDFAALGVDALSLSAHKLGGPKGAGALVIDRRVELNPQLAGGGQEQGARSGTENVAAIVGFGVACELASRELAARAGHCAALRDRLEAGLARLGATLFGAGARRLPNTSFFAFPGIDGETLVVELDRAGYALASGSACSSDSVEPSPVLLAMGIEAELAKGALRVSLGPTSSATEIDGLLAALERELRRLRSFAALAA